jgi:hypothetical protein
LFKNENSNEELEKDAIMSNKSMDTPESIEIAFKE